MANCCGKVLLFVKVQQGKWNMITVILKSEQLKLSAWFSPICAIAFCLKAIDILALIVEKSNTQLQQAHCVLEPCHPSPALPNPSSIDWQQPHSQPLAGLQMIYVRSLDCRWHSQE